MQVRAWARRREREDFAAPSPSQACAICLVLVICVTDSGLDLDSAASFLGFAPDLAADDCILELFVWTFGSLCGTHLAVAPDVVVADMRRPSDSDRLLGPLNSFATPSRWS